MQTGSSKEVSLDAIKTSNFSPLFFLATGLRELMR